MIKISNLDKYYSKGKENEIHVINKVNLALPDTGLVSFLGPSGCGKTTLLNVIGGLDKGDSGVIEYDELKVEKYNSKLIDSFRNKNISYIFQNYLLLPDLTVYENLRLALEIIGIMDNDEVDKRIAYTLTAVGMYKYRKKLARALSGGQQQRVAIARALLKNSKIVLADEPTGNLDKKNSIEVMNILKKVSEKTLVLLVTHNKELAEFYSDKILLLKDGEVLNERKGSLDTLATFSDNTIYLEDLNKAEDIVSGLNLKLYSDTNSEASIRIIRKNDRLFIESDLEIQLINNNVKILENREKEISKENIRNFDYDTSWYSKPLTKEKESFFKIFKYNFLNLFRSNRKAKIFNFLFILIGALFAITTIILANAISQEINFTGLKDKYMVEFNYNDAKDVRDKLTIAYDLGYIDEFSDFAEAKIRVINKKTFLESNEFRVSCNLMPSSYINKGELLFGKLPGITNVLITKGIASSMLDNFGLSDYDTLIGRELEIEEGKRLTISGITNNDGMAIYVNPISGIFNNTNKYEVYNSTYNYFYKDDLSYELLEGRDIEDETFEAVAFSNTNFKVGDIVPVSTYYDGASDFGKYDVKIVGIAKPLKYANYERGLIISDKKLIRGLIRTNVGDYAPSSLASYEIISGRDVENVDECLVPDNSMLEDETFFGKYKIVGTYRAKRSDFFDSAIISEKAYNYDLPNSFSEKINTSYEYLGFSVNNLEALRELVGYNIDTIYNLRAKNLKSQKMDGIIVKLSIALSLLIVSTVYVYFIMRSKLISSIYPTAVLRSIGASKGFIYRRFLIELLVITLFTNLLGFLGIHLIYFGIVSAVESLLGFRFFVTNIGLFFAGILAIVLVNFSVGILPIHRYLKDTPYEAASKYDI